VIDLLHEVACGHVDVLRQPAPVVLCLGFGESALDFELRAWTASFETSLQTKSELTLAVSEALAAAGIEIPFPQRDLHLRSIDAGPVRAPGDAAVVRGLADGGGVPAAGATGVDAPADGEASVPVRGDGGAGRS
jgi:small-conductance mechanosensitive channel